MSLSEGNYFELMEIGDRFYRAKKWEHALAAYSEAEELDEDTASEDADLHFKRGYILFALKRIDESTNAYENCVALDENHSAAWLNLALCRQILENWTDAQESFQKAAELSPENTKCWEGLALCEGAGMLWTRNA